MKVERIAVFGKVCQYLAANIGSAQLFVARGTAHWSRLGQPGPTRMLGTHRGSQSHVGGTHPWGAPLVRVVLVDAERVPVKRIQL